MGYKMYKIVFVKKAKKALDKLEFGDKERIVNALDRIVVRPEAFLVRLVGDKLYKFRVGDYRLIIDLINDELIILVVKIGHRKNVYK